MGSLHKGSSKKITFANQYESFIFDAELLRDESKEGLEDEIEFWESHSYSFDEFEEDSDIYTVPIIIQESSPNVSGILKKTASGNDYLRSEDKFIKIEDNEDSETFSTISTEKLTDLICYEYSESSRQDEESTEYEVLEEVEPIEELNEGGIRIEELGRLKEFIDKNIVRTDFTEEEDKELYYFVKDMCRVLTGGAKQMKLHHRQDIYSWLAFIYIQFFGYLYFLQRLKEFEGDMNESALWIVELIDDIAGHVKIFEEGNLRMKVAKEFLYRLLGSPPMQGNVEVLNYLGVGDAKLPLSWPTGLKMETSSKDDTCKLEFQGILKVAYHLTTEVILRSKHYTEERKGIPVEVLDVMDEIENRAFEKVKRHLFSFPKIQDFSEYGGKIAIQEYIADTWQYSDHWRHSTEFLVGLSDHQSDYYIYEVKWCIPTNRFPIAQATASVFFKIEVCRLKPKLCPVTVTYSLEGNSYQHDPFGEPFQEEWLSYIINSKLKLFKRLRF